MNNTFLDACYRQKTEHTPVWFMRQAGRYLPAYKKLKGKHNILDIVRNPEFAAKISLQPVDILHVDAAILYADIMIPLLGIGVDLAIVENIGPVIREPIQTLADVKKLRSLSPTEDVSYLLQTIQIVTHELNGKVPLIGFSAAPFTLASYLIEGKPTRDFFKTKSMMYGNQKAWHLLMKRLTEIITVYLQAQATAGIQAIQLFDSWVGFLSEEDYIEFVLPYTKQIFANLQATHLPRIHFGTNTAGMLQTFASVDCEVIGVDWRIPIHKAWKEIGYEKAIQGNLDPAVATADFSLIKKRVDDIFTSLPKKEGYIFNLGHGVSPQTPVENLIRLTDYIHQKK